MKLKYQHQSYPPQWPVGLHDDYASIAPYAPKHGNLRWQYLLIAIPKRDLCHDMYHLRYADMYHGILSPRLDYE
ncbi:hypothetical protein [Rosenbergiella nectarea]|uniref:hypothetical protein n=1 Tax=Rosenbergiella nectarea TaxID=988801 RepID=UPI00115FCBE7|nr:hypothetical protein [Rosenbergiella nectarea]